MLITGGIFYGLIALTEALMTGTVHEWITLPFNYRVYIANIENIRKKKC